jgi:DNA replication protein DnaD
MVLARPNKDGLSYFPHDTKLDDKFDLIEAKYGLIGYGIIFKLYEKIYDNGYFYKWNEDEQLLLSRKINVDINLINDVINNAIKWELFDKNKYNEYKILTSHGIQKRFIEAANRRKKINMVSEYIIVDINLINVNINLINVDINLQTKVNQSKPNNIYNTNTNINIFNEQEIFELTGVSVNDQLDFYKNFEIKGNSAKSVIQDYLINGMDFEVIKNGLRIPFQRNADKLTAKCIAPEDDVGFEIEDPIAYGFKILENWNNFNVKTIDDVKKYNKLFKVKSSN